MNNDIKEILEFKEDADYKKLSVDEIVELENYIIDLLVKIELLKDKIRKNEKCRRKMQKSLQQRIDKAIEYIEESLYILKGDGDIPIATSNVRNRYIKPLLNILKGSDE